MTPNQKEASLRDLYKIKHRLEKTPCSCHGRMTSCIICEAYEHICISIDKIKRL